MLNKQNQTITIDGKTYELREVATTLPSVEPPKSAFEMQPKSDLIPGKFSIPYRSKEDRIRDANETRTNFNKEHGLFRLYGYDADLYSFDVIGLQPSATMLVPKQNIENFEWTGNCVVDGAKTLICNIEDKKDEVQEMLDRGVGVGPLMVASYLAGAADGARQASLDVVKYGLNTVNNYTEQIAKDIEKRMNLIEPINDNEDESYAPNSMKNHLKQCIKPIPVPHPFPC